MRDTLPPFTSQGVLPPDDYLLTIAQLMQSHLVTGAGSDSATWDTAWRRILVENLRVLVEQLWSVGIERIFVDGSFVENKDHPGDIDGYFECEARRFVSGDLTRELNLLDPHKVWTWSPHDRRPDKNSAKRQLPMWHQYRVEFYPHYADLPCGITDRFGNALQFPAAFRQSRNDYQQKGIVQIIR